MCRKVYFIPVFIATRPPALQVLPVAAFYILGNSIFRKCPLRALSGQEIISHLEKLVEFID
jgi:hypothetical protein